MKKYYTLNEIESTTGKTFKLLGYCPSCHGMIGDIDLEEGKKNVILCLKCGYRGRTKTLVSTSPLNDKKSKKSFLDDTTTSFYADSISFKDDIPDEFESFVTQNDDWD